MCLVDLGSPIYHGESGRWESQVVGRQDWTDCNDVQGPGWGVLSSRHFTRWKYSRWCVRVPDGKIFNPKVSETFLYAWDRQSGKELYRQPSWGFSFVDYSPDGQRLIGFRSQKVNEVLIADAATGKLIHQLRGHASGLVEGYAFSLDCKLLITGGFDRTAVVWNLELGGPVFNFQGIRGAVDVLRFSPDGKTLMAGCKRDCNCALWETETGKLRRWLANEGKGDCLSAAFSPSGREILVGYGSEGGGIGAAWAAPLYGVDDGKVLRNFSGHLDGAQDIAISPDGKLVATRDSSQKVRIWDFDTGKLNREIVNDNGSRLSSIRFANDNELIGVGRVQDAVAAINLTSSKVQNQFKHDVNWPLTLSLPMRLIWPRWNQRLRSGVYVSRYTMLNLERLCKLCCPAGCKPRPRWHSPTTGALLPSLRHL